MAKNKKKQPLSRKRLCIVVIVAVLVLAAAGFGIYRLATYETANHADRMTDSTLINHNRTVSGKAIATGNIQSREILLLNTLTKTTGQDSTAEFLIFRLPEGAKGEDFMHLRADEVGEDSPLIYMGTFTCRIVENDPNSVYDMRATYVR